jgi:ABC-type lipoprotein release transport system permease subunit
VKQLIPLYWKSLKRLKKSSWGKNSIFMILGIIIAVGALSLSMILFESYEETLSQAFKASQPDIVIVNNSQEITPTQEAKLNSILAKYKNDIRAIANRKKLSVIISRKGEKSPAYLEGFYQENSAYNSLVYPFANNKSFQLGENQIILGQYLAKELNAEVGDTIQVILPSSIRYSIFGLVNQSQDLIVKDVYKTGLYDIDLTRAIVSSDKLLTLSGKKLKDSDYSLILNQRNSDKSSEIASQLNRDFMTSLPILYAHDVISYDSSIFAALTLQKMMIFLILCIIIIVAAFNVISTISTIINEKIEEIGILMTLGLKRSQVKLLYYIFSLLLTHIGIILGLLVGYALAYLLTHQDYFTLKADIYFIDKIMINPSFSSLILIYGTTLLIMSVTILLSLRSINKLEIIKILRR